MSDERNQPTTDSGENAMTFNPETATAAELLAECERRLVRAEKLNDEAASGPWHHTRGMVNRDRRDGQTLRLATCHWNQPLMGGDYITVAQSEANAHLIASMRNVERARLEYLREDFEECQLQATRIGKLMPTEFDSMGDYREAVQFQYGDLTHRIRRILAALPEVTT